ncbi:hypothetical protein CDV36_000695 [Fusarium kuroshium]|uniref:F-box domain-containing protein n=1 Tax=Fusarium kuroshium TaxID=2010991 RepID=A0A3M2SQ50_9HYPO|nr:hypothetical protein CDV36_000695 [Fusarium kuroshium]
METAKPDRLSSLPPEIIFELFPYISLDEGGFSLVRASKRFYNLLIVELYKEAGRNSNWAPLFVGAISGNINTLERCHKAGAPLNYRWPGKDPVWWVLHIEEGYQPLHVAMMHYQVEAVQWFLEKKVNPYEKEEKGKIRTLDLICESRLLKGHYPTGRVVVARWKDKRLRIPNKGVLALRGRKIFDKLCTAGASHNPRLSKALQWRPDQVEVNKPVGMKRLICQDVLSILPCEILLKILSNLSPVDGGYSLVATSRFLYRTLILDLYREAGRQLSWLPLFVGAMDGNLLTLETCLKAGAPIDYQWEANHLTSGWRFHDWARPLHVAIEHVHMGSVKWLLDKGANPGQTKEEKVSRCYAPPRVVAGLIAGKPEIPRYAANKQTLWWRGRNFTTPNQAELKQESQEIYQVLVEAAGEPPPRPVEMALSVLTWFVVGGFH